MSSAHGGRRRPLTRTTSSSEDQALNQIAREAEARLAAKRAARAEARSIRMKELERQQQEGEDVDDDDQAVNDEPPVPPARKKTPVSRSMSSGSAGLSIVGKDQSIDMNGPVVPEKVLKSIQDNLKETEEDRKRKEEREKAYWDKKAKKPAVIAKSSLLIDIKPWDDETDMKEVERLVRSIQSDGLVWGASKLVPLAYGIKKLQISCVIEDDKISTDFLEEEITKFEDHVQSMDVAAFNKI